MAVPAAGARSGLFGGCILALGLALWRDDGRHHGYRQYASVHWSFCPGHHDLHIIARKYTSDADCLKRAGADGTALTCFTMKLAVNLSGPT